MSTPSIKELVRTSLLDTKRMYLQDLEAMGHDELAKSPGGSARTPYDFTYETAFVNRRIATRLRGEDPGPSPGDAWITAPAEFQDKERALQEFAESADAVIAGWDGTPDEAISAKITLPSGDTTALDMAKLAAYHMGYHDAQLNYHQAICGDEAVHWKKE